MGNRCPFTRISINKSVIWHEMETLNHDDKIKFINEKGYEAYYKIDIYWVKQQTYQYHVVDDIIFDWIKNNRNNVQVVISAKIQRSPEKAWLHPKSEHDVSSMLEASGDADISGMYILFKNKNDCAKFKLIHT